MEIVYILVNEAMPGFVKIGRTTDLEQRIRSLDTTSVPLPFECFYACTVKDAQFVEGHLHDAFLDHRVRSSREFFEIDPERAVSALKLVEVENVTPRRDFVESEEDLKALNVARERQSIFNFKLADIPIGAEISFSRDNAIKAQVIDNRSIMINGEIKSLTRAVKDLLGNERSVQGPRYWMYEGELLNERRKRIELEG